MKTILKIYYNYNFYFVSHLDILKLLSKIIVMINENFFEKFYRDRNIRNSTKKGYNSAIISYEKFHNMAMSELVVEALNEENEGIPLRNRKLKGRLLDYRSHVLNSKLSPNTVRTYFSKIKTIYRHHEVEIPYLPEAKYEKIYEINYHDLPTHKHIAQALEIVSVDLKAIILFMSSSGTAKAETLSLTVGDFIDATMDYHNGGSVKYILDTLSYKKNIVPTFYLKRIKTAKYYYTFCSPEASEVIVKYLKTRENLKKEDKLFDFTNSSLLNKFQEINDMMKWGFKGKYRFFRSHTLRKFHASNIVFLQSILMPCKGEVKMPFMKLILNPIQNSLKVFI